MKGAGVASGDVAEDVAFEINDTVHEGGKLFCDSVKAEEAVEFVGDFAGGGEFREIGRGALFSEDRGGFRGMREHATEGDREECGRDAVTADVEDIDADFSIAEGDDIESITAEFIAGFVSPGDFDSLDDAGSTREEGALDAGGGLEVSGHSIVGAFKSGVGIFELDLEAVEFEVGFDACVEFLHLKGLGDVVDTAKAEGADFVEGFGEGADEDDRDSAEPFVGLELFADLIAIHFGHVNVEEDEVGWLTLCGEERELSTGDRADLVAAILEHGGEDLEVGGGVVNDEDIGGAADVTVRLHRVHGPLQY
jgi:hypothetical protein